MSENGNGAGTNVWTEVPRQPKQRYCHECKKRTFYWLFEREGAVCSDCVNLRNMQAPPAKAEPAGGIGPAKKSRSTIAPAKKIAILAKRATGGSKASISKDVGVAIGTVTKVLNENDFDRAIEEGRFQSVRLIPIALNGLEKSMNKGDGQVCNRFLENVGVLAGKPNGKSGFDPTLSVAIGQLIYNGNPPQAKPAAAIDAEVVSSSPSPSSSQS
jgi:hypothetical protein